MTSLSRSLVAQFGPADSPLHLSCIPEGAEDREMPLIVAAEPGFSCLDLELRQWPRADLRDGVLEVADAMRDASDGLWLAFIGAPVGRPLILIQSDRSQFYAKNHGPGYAGHGRVWRDYYARAAYYAFDFLNEHWHLPAVEIAHPTASPSWPPQALESFLDGMRRWVARTPGRDLSDVYFRTGGPCGVRSPDDLAKTATMLAAEDTNWNDVPIFTTGDCTLNSPKLQGMAVFRAVDILWQPGAD